METVLRLGLSNGLAALALAAAALAVTAWYRRPALAHGLWLLVLVKLVTPPLVFVPVPRLFFRDPPPPKPTCLAADKANPAPEFVLSWVQPDALAVPGVEVPGDGPEPSETQPEEQERPAAESPATREVDWRGTVLGVWAVGSVGWFGLAFARLAAFGRLLRHARPAPEALQEETRRLAGRLGLSRCPAVWLIPGRLAPMLWAAGGRPRLLVPAGLLKQTDGEQQATLLIHELAHLRRRDHWVRFLEMVVTGLYWWHPVVWLARRRLREAEEQCCDAWVVQTLPTARRSYATALLETLDFLSEPRAAVPALASGLGTVSDLKRRMTMILKGTTPGALTGRGLLAVLAVGALALPLLPTWAQAEARDEEEQQAAPKDPRAEQARRAELAAAQAALEKAEADLAQKRADLQKKRAELGAMEARYFLRDVTARGQDNPHVIVFQEAAAPAAAAGPGKHVIVIELTGLEGKPEEIQETVKKLEKELKASHPKIKAIVVRADGAHGAGQGVLRFVTPGAVQGQAVGTIQFQPAANAAPAIVTVPAHVGAVQSPAAVAPVQPAAPATAARITAGITSDKRIDNLEKKLEALLKEMEALRRDLKKSGAGRDPLDRDPSR